MSDKHFPNDFFKKKNISNDKSSEKNHFSI